MGTRCPLVDNNISPSNSLDKGSDNNVSLANRDVVVENPGLEAVEDNKENLCEEPNSVQNNELLTKVEESNERAILCGDSDNEPIITTGDMSRLLATTNSCSTNVSKRKPDCDSSNCDTNTATLKTVIVDTPAICDEHTGVTKKRKRGRPKKSEGVHHGPPKKSVKISGRDTYTAPSEKTEPSKYASIFTKANKPPKTESSKLPEKTSEKCEKRIQMDTRNKGKEKTTKKKNEDKYGWLDFESEDDELTEDQTNFINKIKEFLASADLDLEPTPFTKADGNCWFRAIAAQVDLMKVEEIPRNHRQIRQFVADSVKNLPDDIKATTIDVAFNGKPRGLCDLASRQRKDGQWVDDNGIMVMATAIYVRRNINIYSFPSDNTRKFNVTHIEGGPEAGKHEPLKVFLENRHYQSLGPKSPAQ